LIVVDGVKSVSEDRAWKPHPQFKYFLDRIHHS
jgi:hypothetical protein